MVATGVAIDAMVSPELLVELFVYKGPLHDGAVVIAGDRIVAAGAVLPLTETSVYRERFGMRAVLG